MTSPPPQQYRNQSRTALRRMLLAYSISLFGALLASGIVAWIAITDAGVSGSQLGLLTGTASLAAAVTALLIAPRIDGWSKKSVMITLDLLAGSALLTLSTAAWTDRVTVPHLAVVAAIEVSASLLFAAASTPMLKAVSGEQLDWALGRQETVYWAAQLLGPPAGGVITSVIGAPWTVIANSMSFFVSAVLLAGVSTPEPTRRCEPQKPRLTDGLRTILTIPKLRALYFNAALFGTALLSVGPVLALFMVRDLGLSAWEYGLVLGVPCLGGMVAGTFVHKAIARVGRDRLLLTTGLLRTVWLLPMAAIPAGSGALAAMLALQTGLLFTTSLFNATFASTRIAVTPPERLSAVIGSWNASTRCLHPLGIALTGFMVDIFSMKAAIVCASSIALASSVPLALNHLRDRKENAWNGSLSSPQKGSVNRTVYRGLLRVTGVLRRVGRRR
ncbi:MFS transporter [Streptomyces griseoincarnatus]